MSVEKDSDLYAKNEVSKLSGKPAITDIELSKHASEESLWVAIYGKVFDLTEFYMDHPGGWDVIEESAGLECSLKFEDGDH